MCIIEKKEDGSFIQICNCKHGSDNCKERDGKETSEKTN